jgi:hypothetical protein
MPRSRRAGGFGRSHRGAQTSEPGAAALSRARADEAGGKLPLFDRNGREVSRKTIESCVAQGWATPWVHNPIKPDWLVCRLTEAGYRVLGGEPPS